MCNTCLKCRYKIHTITSQFLLRSPNFTHRSSVVQVKPFIVETLRWVKMSLTLRTILKTNITGYNLVVTC